mmetsp:Transcript_24221/g.38799  ORF Transcript_24221/g.38799 Transcript_24221/m.38799 type:complete len:211 (-) Transcript_24221:8-640(-)
MPNLRQPGGRYFSIGFDTTFISVSLAFAARIFCRCRSSTIKPANRLNVRGIRSEGWISIRTLLAVCMYISSFPALLRGLSRSAMRHWWVISGLTSAKLRPVLAQMPLWSSLFSSSMAPLRGVTHSSGHFSSTTTMRRAPIRSSSVRGSSLSEADGPSIFSTRLFFLFFAFSLRPSESSPPAFLFSRFACFFALGFIAPNKDQQGEGKTIQ